MPSSSSASAQGRNHQLCPFFAARYPFLPFPGSPFFPRPSAPYLLTGNSANIRETLNGLFGDRHGGRDFGARSARKRPGSHSSFATNYIVRRVLRSLLPAGVVIAVSPRLPAGRTVFPRLSIDNVGIPHERRRSFPYPDLVTSSNRLVISGRLLGIYSEKLMSLGEGGLGKYIRNNRFCPLSPAFPSNTKRTFSPPCV